MVSTELVLKSLIHPLKFSWESVCLIYFVGKVGTPRAKFILDTLRVPL